MDLEYMICFYSFELDWTEHKGLFSKTSEAYKNAFCLSKLEQWVTNADKCLCVQIKACVTATPTVFGQ